MRQILKQNYSFSSTFKAYINTKINQAKEMEEIHPLKFHEKFKKLYILQKRE